MLLSLSSDAQDISTQQQYSSSKGSLFYYMCVVPSRRMISFMGQIMLLQQLKALAVRAHSKAEEVL